jgi:hypothetical protein
MPTIRGQGMSQAEIDSRKKSQFIRVLLNNGGFKEQAIKECRTSRRWFNEQLEADPEFALAVDTIVDVTNEQLVMEARRRALGYEEPIVYQGKIQTQYVDGRNRPCTADTPGARLVPATVTKVSDNLLMFLIKGRMPEYREGPGKKVSDLSDEELNDTIRRWLASKKGKMPELATESVS